MCQLEHYVPACLSRSIGLIVSVLPLHQSSTAKTRGPPASAMKIGYTREGLASEPLEAVETGNELEADGGSPHNLLQ